MSLRIALAAALLAAAGAASAVEPGATAPDFSLTPFAGTHSVSLADYRGKVVLVDFWASWCSPCRQSLPLYNGLQADFPVSEFAILAVGLDENSDDARAFLREHPVKYTALQDPRGDVAQAFGLKGMPSSYLIDRAGIVRYRHIGFEPEDINALKREITALIAKPAAAH
ncbi:MAG: TlpA family protein disulfide reductase [Xanthomonadaceae bacterium]|nr:TlpA family protein disulfide reductase [Xanthomonadaceae bacterium]MDE1960849.1 TlpA family protein disulfide reductase [Xanthomonadaceae bacterium]MDE2085173.1 TlpA family protein disulfide reductase [Xanthomonadaceae bacterium]MDE2258159.1 TlpA family protein disulfide reductase [Xanthomonadaceae bacterium]